MSEIIAAIVSAVLAWIAAKRLKQPQAQYVYCQEIASVSMAMDSPPGPISIPTYERDDATFAANMALPKTRLQCNGKPVNQLTVIQLRFWNATQWKIVSPSLHCTLAGDARVLMVERYKARGPTDRRSMEVRIADHPARMESLTLSEPTNSVTIGVDELLPHFNSEDLLIAELYVEGTVATLDVSGDGDFSDGTIWSVNFRRSRELAARRRFWSLVRFRLGVLGFLLLFAGYAGYAAVYPVTEWLAVDGQRLSIWLTRPPFITLSILLLIGLWYALMMGTRWFTIPLPRKRFIHVLADRRPKT